MGSDAGLDPGSPGSQPGLKADAHPLGPPGAPLHLSKRRLSPQGVSGNVGLAHGSKWARRSTRPSTQNFLKGRQGGGHVGNGEGGREGATPAWGLAFPSVLLGVWPQAPLPLCPPQPRDPPLRPRSEHFPQDFWLWALSLQLVSSVSSLTQKHCPAPSPEPLDRGGDHEKSNLATSKRKAARVSNRAHGPPALLLHLSPIPAFSGGPSSNPHPPPEVPSW